MSEGMAFTKMGLFLVVIAMGVAIMPIAPVGGFVQIIGGATLFTLYLRKMLKERKP